MNNTNTQQPPKKITAILLASAMMGNIAAGKFRNELLTNGGRYGIQHRKLNQRQKRKIARQTQRN